MPRPPVDPATRLPGLRVVVVENHEDTLLYLTRYLRSLGHQVQSATSVQEALELVPGSDCQVLISDIGLPDGDGWEMICQINPARHVYAVAFSGYCSREDQERSFAVGYHRHLTKPVTLDHINEVLAAARAHQNTFASE
ncbi:response regulator [Verrucomicrobium sp. BvORR106]|uniref:response regulator n=1 Tax=Verrucomicrobium sp. BvORR106 TaxID=1403819 RepID=UPI000570CEC5|nr:response regulator [Verrucomicrobium sp. BvORR106]